MKSGIVWIQRNHMSEPENLAVGYCRDCWRVRQIADLNAEI